MQHHFDVDIAKRYGMVEAILLNHFEYWIELNRSNNKNFYDGRYWTFNSMKAFSDIFPYITEKKIRNALKHLQDEGLIITGNYNRSAYDRTLWYAFSDLAESILLKGQMDLPEKANQFCQKGEPIPDNNTDIIPDNKKDIKKGVFEEFSKDNQDLLEALNAFEEMRKAIKKPLTEKAKHMVCKKLEKMSSEVVDKERYMIESLEQSTVNCYQGVFPVKDFQDKAPEEEKIELVWPEFNPDFKTLEELIP